MIDCHFMAHFFFMKCECVVTGHRARIELSLYLSVGFIGLLLMTTTAAAGIAGVVGKLVVAVAAIMRPADAVFVPVVRSLVPVHLERCSFQVTHSQIPPHSK